MYFVQKSVLIYITKQKKNLFGKCFTMSMYKDLFYQMLDCFHCYVTIKSVFILCYVFESTLCKNKCLTVESQFLDNTEFVTEISHLLYVLFLM